MTDTPTLDDIDIERSREIGKIIKQLEEGDRIQITNHRLDRYLIGKIIEKTNRPNDKEFYKAMMVEPDGTRAEIHANWRDITPDQDDQETPYTGLLQEPINDTAPAVTDIKRIGSTQTMTDNNDNNEPETHRVIGGAFIGLDASLEATQTEIEEGAYNPYECLEDELKDVLGDDGFGQLMESSVFFEYEVDQIE
jgi:hypothetical protein